MALERDEVSNSPRKRKNDASKITKVSSSDLAPLSDSLQSLSAHSKSELNIVGGDASNVGPSSPIKKLRDSADEEKQRIEVTERIQYIPPLAMRKSVKNFEKAYAYMAEKKYIPLFWQPFTNQDIEIKNFLRDYGSRPLGDDFSIKNYDNRAAVHLIIKDNQLCYSLISSVYAFQTEGMRRDYIETKVYQGDKRIDFKEQTTREAAPIHDISIENFKESSGQPYTHNIYTIWYSVNELNLEGAELFARAHVDSGHHELGRKGRGQYSFLGAGEFLTTTYKDRTYLIWGNDKSGRFNGTQKRFTFPSEIQEKAFNKFFEPYFYPGCSFVPFCVFQNSSGVEVDNVKEYVPEICAIIRSAVDNNLEPASVRPQIEQVVNKAKALAELHNPRPPLNSFTAGKMESAVKDQKQSSHIQLNLFPRFTENNTGKTEVLDKTTLFFS